MMAAFKKEKIKFISKEGKMMRKKTNVKVLLFLALTSLVSCNDAITAKTKVCSINYESDLEKYDEKIASGTGFEEEAPVECILPTPVQGQQLGINIIKQNFNEQQTTKMDDAIERLLIVINSEEFKEKVLAHTFNGERTFSLNNGLTNEEIYEQIMSGIEVLNKELDYEMDVDVTLYYKAGSTVGYTYANTNRTWINSKFFNGFRPSQIVANVTHEWTHKIGFGHTSNNSPSRPYTVPYGIGSIISDLVDEM
jgi:hypothetical protein